MVHAGVLKQATSPRALAKREAGAGEAEVNGGGRIARRRGLRNMIAVGLVLVSRFVRLWTGWYGEEVA